MDLRLHALHSRGDKLEDLAHLFGMSREEVRQRITLFEDRTVVESLVAEGDPRKDLAEALACGDEFAFLDIIAENPEQFRWINPAALNGAEVLRSFHSEQIAQLTADEHGKPSMAECVTVVLSNHPSPMASIELLQAIIPHSKRLVIISTRTALRTLLADPF
jgi:DNA-binding Lrp family transcriptional regulator